MVFTFSSQFGSENFGSPAAPARWLTLHLWILDGRCFSSIESIEEAKTRKIRHSLWIVVHIHSLSVWQWTAFLSVNIGGLMKNWWDGKMEMQCGDQKWQEHEDTWVWSVTIVYWDVLCWPRAWELSDIILGKNHRDRSGKLGLRINRQSSAYTIEKLV